MTSLNQQKSADCASCQSGDEDKSTSPDLKLPRKRPKWTTLISWVLVALWAGLIFFMSTNTSSGLSGGLGIFSHVYQVLASWQESIFGPGVDVMSPIAHFFEYLVFGALLARALRHHMPLRRACILAIVFASLYGVTDEFHQYFVPGRMSDPLDWLVDTIGASVGAGLVALFHSSPNCMR